MAVTQADMDRLRQETIAKRKSIADATAQREGALKTSLSDTLASRSTLSDEAKSALSNKQLQSLVDRTPNQRLTSSLTPDQLSGQQAITPDVTVPKTQELTSALANQIATQPTTQTTQPSSVASNISQGFNEQSKALVQALKQRIAESQQSQKDLISKAPQQYDPLRAQSEVQKAQQLRSVLEQSANVGDRGGVGRQQALLTQTEGANRLNAIDLQQQNFVDQANSEIARLQNEGRYQEAEILANSKAQELQALLGEQVRQEGLSREASALERQQFAQTAPQFYENYQAQINKVLGDNDPTNDWQADILATLRQEKIGSQESAKAEAEKESQAFNEDVRRFEKEFGLNMRKQTVAEAQQAIQNAISRGNLSVSQGNLALRQAQLLATNDPNSVENQQKLATLESTQLRNQALEKDINAPEEVIPPDIRPYTDVIDTRFFTKDPNTGETIQDTTAIQNHLNDLQRAGVSTEDTDRIAAIYGIY